jgi:CRISPR-associated protein Cmr2
MATHNEKVWRAILAAWTHDPAEKAIILMRGESHEAGTVKVLRERIFGSAALPADIQDSVKKADHWASGADRPQFGAGGYATWAQVRFDKNPELIHPLSGERIDKLHGLDIGVQQIKQVSESHFSSLIQSDGASVDLYKTALAFWRFGPKPPAPKLGELWSMLPADTRVPDHTIWAHLDLSAALAAAFAGDAESRPALLNVAFGPVQDFIAQARSTSDLWAGSHLLAQIAWKGMEVVCERYGPGAFLFPQLRGVPQVDIWLKEQGLPDDLFADEDWKRGATDANPLFAAALPNRFLAIVPHDDGKALAVEIERRVRAWAKEQANETLKRLLNTANEQEASTAQEQIERQFDGFPEVHWSLTPWLGDKEGSETLNLFYPKTEKQPGFYASAAWDVLSGGELEVDNLRFFTPNDGTFYPVNYELAERSLAAAKSLRPFRQLHQEGYRCSLCGEREWLTSDREQLQTSPRQQSSSLWAKVARSKPAWARTGEHLCALCATKRLWPTRYAEQVGQVLGRKFGRYVVSTHTMALATTMERWLQMPNICLGLPLRSALESEAAAYGRTALPRKLTKAIRQLPDDSDQSLMLHYYPALVESLRERSAAYSEQIENIEKQFIRELGAKPETYYALILMDGDHMGKWLSGGEQGIAYQDAWHSAVTAGLKQRARKNRRLTRYLTTPRAVSPARHMAISAALNGFALDLVPYVVEEVFKGKLIYAGGDDVLAMVSTDDLLPALWLLRMVYAGIAPTEEAWKLLSSVAQDIKIDKGHVYLKDRLYRVMGRRATASAGAVVAHHQAPLGRVLKELRDAEKRAKNNGRDSFSISVLSRSGGHTEFTSHWRLPEPGASTGMESTPMGLLIQTRNLFREPDMSRRAAYIMQDWLRQMPAQPPEGMLQQSLAYQFARQGANRNEHQHLGGELARLAEREGASKEGENKVKDYLHGLLAVAEFFARTARSGDVA